MEQLIFTFAETSTATHKRISTLILNASDESNLLKNCLNRRVSPIN